MKKLIFLVFLLSSYSILAEQSQYADAFYTNSKVYTVNPGKPWAEAFAVKNGKFLAVGSGKDISIFIGPKTKVLDLKGKFIMPGMVEDHVHPDMVAESMMGVLLKPSEMSWRDQVSKIREFVKANKGTGWVVGGNLNWLADEGEPILGSNVASHFSTLDQLIPDRPAMLWDIGGHAALLNSRAISVLNLSSASENPEGGIIVKDSNGKLTGVLRESAANKAYETALKELPRGTELIEKGIKPVFSRLSQLGYTSISDVWARHYMLEAYRDMADNKDLPLRIRAYIADPIEWQSEEWQKSASFAINNHKSFYRENWLDASGVKFVLDGSAGGKTIIMVDPYQGTADVHGGPWRNDPAYFRRKFIEYDARGITIKSHGVGSQAIRTILDAIEEVRASGSTLRHSVAHAVFIHPDDLQRFSKLDVIAEFSPYFWYPVPGWDIVREELGQKRIDWAFPFNTMMEQGVNVSVGSDWPVADDPNPFPSIESMITRQAAGGKTPAIPLDKEKISLADAIRAFTMGGAFAQNREKVIGSIEAGKLADFVVLDRNLFELDFYQIHKTKVIKTVVGGRTVYQQN